MSIADPHFEPAAVLAIALHITDCLPHARARTTWSDEHMQAHGRHASKVYTAVKDQNHRLVPAPTRPSEDFVAEPVYAESLS